MKDRKIVHTVHSCLFQCQMLMSAMTEHPVMNTPNVQTTLAPLPAHVKLVLLGMVCNVMVSSFFLAGWTNHVDVLAQQRKI